MPARTTRRLCLTLAASLLAFAGHGGAPAEATSTFVYVHAKDSSADSKVYGYLLETDGHLTPVAGSPFAEPDTSGDCEGFCNAVSWAASPGVLLTAGGTGISSFAVGTDGSLITTPGSPFQLQVGELSTSVAAVQVGTRTFAYATQYYGDSMDGFEVGDDGTLTRAPGLPVTGYAGVSVLGGGGDKIVFLDETHRKLQAYKVGADGSITAAPGKAPRVPGRGSLYYVTVAPSGKTVYTGEWTKGKTVYSYAIADTTAKLRRGPSVKLKIKDADGGISLASNSLAAVFASGGAKDVQIFSLSTTGRFVRRGAPQASGLTHVTAHAFSPDGRFLVVGSASSGLVRTYSVDATTGKLSQIDTEVAPASIAMNGMVVLTR